MKLKSLIAVSLVVLTAYTPAQAAQSAKYVAVTKAFNTLLSSNNNTLDELDAKYEADMNAADEALSKASNDALSVYQQELNAASALYNPLIAASTKAIADARVSLLANRGVKVLALGTNRNYWGNLKCPPPVAGGDYPAGFDFKSCNGVDKGPQFTVGQQTYLVDEIAVNNPVLDEIDLMISLGLIELLQPVAFKAASATLHSEPVTLASNTSKYTTAQQTAIQKRDRNIASAKAIRDGQVKTLDSEYQDAKEAIEAQIAASENALLAAKRASKDSSNFDKAFTVAYQFEYNRSQLNALADMPWKYVATYRQLTSLVKVTQLADKADAIASRYSYAAAASLNSSVGSVFTSEVSFRSELKFAQSVFTKAVGKKV
ncbi:hypothetical protein MCEMRE217_00239 [Candidatus Nanopelagicaceae bacterium]